MSVVHYIESLSSEQVLQVGIASATIILNIGPAYEAGVSIDAQSTVKNTGDVTGSFLVKYYRGATLLKTTSAVDIAAGQTNTFTEIGLDTMPSSDTTYKAEAYVNGELGASDSKTVKLIQQIATTTTAQLSAAKVPLGGTYKITGKLTRNDTGAAVATGQIQIEKLNGSWQTIKLVTTDASGNYDSGNLTAPTTQATLTLRAHYNGNIFEGLAESFSPSLTMATTLALDPLRIAVSLGLGALSYIATRKVGVALVVTGGSLLVLYAVPSVAQARLRTRAAMG